MKIVHVITRFLRAGTEENTIITCLGHAAAGHELILVHGRDHDPTHYDELGHSIRLVEINSLVHPVDPLKDLRAIAEMTRLFRDLKPDVVHTHQSKAGILGRTAARLASVPRIVHGVHILPFMNVGMAQKVIYLAAERATAPVTHAYINVSAGMRDMCVSHQVGKPDKHHVVRSGMDLQRFASAEPPGDWRRLAGVDEGATRPPIILMLAALEERKRHREFLQVFDRILARVPNARLLLAGEGPCRTEVAAAVAGRGLANHVRLLGHYSQPERLMALADVCILTSMREGLPRVIVQYLAAGKPIVVSELPGIGEIIQNGVNGIVTPSDDLGQAADAVADILLDTGLRARLSRAAQDTDVSRWAAENMCREIWQVYERIAPAARVAQNAP